MPAWLHPNEVIDAAMRLPPAERREVAERLLDSLDLLDDPPLSPEWAAEIERRIDAIDRGEVELLDGEEVLRRLRERFRR